MPENSEAESRLAVARELVIHLSLKLAAKNYADDTHPENGWEADMYDDLLNDALREYAKLLPLVDGTSTVKCMTFPVSLALAYHEAMDDVLMRIPMGRRTVCVDDYLELKIGLNPDGSVHVEETAV